MHSNDTTTPGPDHGAATWLEGVSTAVSLLLVIAFAIVVGAKVCDYAAGRIDSFLANPVGLRR